MKRKILSMLLALAMAITLLPTWALAVAVPDGWTGTAGDTGTMAYQYNGNDNFNIKGTFNGAWKQTTYSDNGFYTYLSAGTPTNPGSNDRVTVDGTARTTSITGVTLAVTLETVLDGGALKITYTVTNSGSESKTVSFGSRADIQIGADDSAKITRLEGDRGFTMVSDDEEYDKDESGDFARFNFFCKDVPNYVDDVDTYWYGYYRDATDNLYNNTSDDSFSGDSGMAYSWKNRTVPAGQSKSFSVLMGIGGADSVNITSKAQMDPYDEENPPDTFTITVNPCDPAKDYILMYKDGETWTPEENTNPTVFGTYEAIGSPSQPAVLKMYSDGWYNNSANTDQKITFHNVRAGYEYRVDERSAVTDFKKDNTTRLPYQDIASGSLTVDTRADALYALYESADGATWTKSAVVPTAVKTEENADGAVADGWYSNSAASGKLTFSFSAADNTQYKIIEKAAHEISGATKSVAVASLTGHEYSLWQGSTLITAEPAARGTDGALIAGSAGGWYTNAATADGTLEWEGLDIGTVYTVRSREIAAVTSSLQQELSATAAEGMEYQLYVQGEGETWSAVNANEWKTATAGETVSWTELDAAKTYKVMQRTEAVAEIPEVPAAGETPAIPAVPAVPAGTPEDAASSSAIYLTASTDSDHEYSLWSGDGTSFQQVTDVDPENGTNPAGYWWNTGAGTIKWRKSELSDTMTYEIRSRLKVGTGTDLNNVKIVSTTTANFDFAVKASAVVTYATVANDSSQAVSPTAENSGWYAGAADSVYQWTIPVTADSAYTVLQRGEYDAVSSLAVVVESPRSYALYVKNSGGEYVATGIAATGTSVTGSAGWYTAANGVTLTFGGLDPTKTYQVKATVITSMDSMVPPSGDTTPGGVDADNSRAVREVYTEGKGETAHEYARITVSNTSNKYEYALALVVKADDGSKTYQRQGNYALGGSQIVYETLDATATYVVYSRLKVTSGTSYPRRSAELGPAVVSTGGGGSLPSNLSVGGSTVIGSTVQRAGQTATITCDPDTLGKYLENAAAGSVVASVYAGDLSEVSTRLIVQNVEQMAQKDMIITIKTPDAAISIPTNAMPLPTMSAEAAATTPVTVTVSKSEVSVPGQIGSAISYTLTVGEGDSATEITRFTGPVTHSVSLSAAQTQQVATAVLVGEDGQIIRSVPTNVQTGSGKVVYTSFTNSTYALISNTVSFSDTADKWYADVANEMGSRKIINGSNGSFSGERAVTRAEFVSILVRALGLPQDGTAQFSDVPTTAYYSGAVASAVECGITSGTGNGKFSPNSLISREQAAVMLTRAAALAGFFGRSGSVNASAFSDYAAISSYAKDSYDFCLNNSISVYSGSKLNSKANVSRGECAVLTLRLMQASGLVDTRATVANPAQETVAEVPAATPVTTTPTTAAKPATTPTTSTPATASRPTATPSTSSGTADTSIPNYRSDTEHAYLWNSLDRLSDPVRKLRLLLQDLNASDVTWNNRNDMRKHAMHARLLIYYGQSLTAEQMKTLTATQRSQMQQYIKGYCTMAGISEIKVF
ncbi:MAG: S-layer homology domain-containing protein [Oscillibacter sp.]|jgi:hypothetical protein|nr:S-layer homology domain-containing protein [Oscillibacter sp.]